MSNEAREATTFEALWSIIDEVEELLSQEKIDFLEAIAFDLLCEDAGVTDHTRYFASPVRLADECNKSRPGEVRVGAQHIRRSPEWDRGYLSRVIAPLAIVASGKAKDFDSALAMIDEHIANNPQLQENP